MMFKHILLPLDGSGLAEATLPVAKYLAYVLKARITLIHVIEKDAVGTIHGERHLTGHEEAEAYLEQIRQREFPAESSVALHVHKSAVKNVAKSIVEHQGELTPDLIVLCSHGWGGVRDLLFGSIAQQVINAGRVPVLLVRPISATGRNNFECRSILSPTDGLPNHEEGLFVAAHLAGAIPCKLNLVAVAPTMRTLAGRQAANRRLIPGTMRTLLEMGEDQLRTYIERMAKRFQDKGVSVNALVCRGEPAERIASQAETSHADLIVFGTHGKAGTEAFWAHSVGARVLAQTSQPALLVRVR
jgi:nucleotide-binding universal stress UspA family protein